MRPHNSLIKAILIDDETNSIESLAHEVKEYCPEVTVIGSFRDSRKGLEAIRELAPDLVFLDIEMPRMNGFELLQSLPSIDFDVIFVTAYDQFAVKAFEFNAVDYLLKPIRKIQLIQAVQKVKERQKHFFKQQDLNALMNNLQLQTKTGLENIALPIGEGFEFIHVNEITHLEGEGNYCWVYLTTGKKYLITKTLKIMEAIIQFPQFFRSHKSHLVNLNHVARYVRGQGGYLVLKDKTSIPVSRSRKEALMQVLNV